MIAVEAKVIVTVAVCVVGLMIGFGKLLLYMYDQRACERHKNLAEKLDGEAQRVEHLQQRVDNLHQRLPLDYVRREDWIRFSGMIDAKLDRLATLMPRQRNHDE